MTSAPLYQRISDYVDHYAKLNPDSIATIIDDKYISYSDLKTQIDKLAKALIASGIKKSDRVATLQTTHPDFIVSFMATVSIGAIWVGLNPRYQTSELIHVIKDAEPTILLTRSEIGGRYYDNEIAALMSATPTLQDTVIFSDNPSIASCVNMQNFLKRGDEISDQELQTMRENCGGRDPCLIVYTSGSTGAPKGAILHHEGICRLSLNQVKLWPVNPQSMLNYFPINHVGSVIDCSCPTIVAGGTIIAMEKFDVRESMKLMQKHRITIWGSVPSVFQMQLALEDFQNFDLTAVQLILWEGAAMPEETINQLIKICPRLATNYGMTETTSAITIVEPTNNIDILANTVGIAFPDVEIRLADTEDVEVALGETGEVQTRSPYNLLGYWKRDDATHDAFTSDGFFKTGDLAIKRADGHYNIVGRIKEMYKSGGYNVYPREVEIALETNKAVTSAAVVSVSDPIWQEVGIAYVTISEPITTEELLNYCRKKLANYKIPKKIIIEQELPLLPIGKIDKVALKRRANDEFA
jgi:acyl-CoA synthetase (AMP-forming)/AMP-acid ligase II